MSRISPCKDCQERHTACHGHCPKDARDEYGYMAWKAEREAIKQDIRLHTVGWSDAYRRAKWNYIRRDYNGAFKKFSS